MYAEANHASRKNRAALQQTLRDIADLNHRLDSEHFAGKQGEVDSKRLQGLHRQPHNQKPHNQSHTEHPRLEKGKFAARCKTRTMRTSMSTRNRYRLSHGHRLRRPSTRSKPPRPQHASHSRTSSTPTAQCAETAKGPRT